MCILMPSTCVSIKTLKLISHKYLWIISWIGENQIKNSPQMEYWLFESEIWLDWLRLHGDCITNSKSWRMSFCFIGLVHFLKGNNKWLYTYCQPLYNMFMPCCKMKFLFNPWMTKWPTNGCRNNQFLVAKATNLELIGNLRINEIKLKYLYIYITS